MKSAHIGICDALCFMKIGWIEPEKNLLTYLESSIQKSVHPSKNPCDIATLLLINIHKLLVSWMDLLSYLTSSDLLFSSFSSILYLYI